MPSVPISAADNNNHRGPPPPPPPRMEVEVELRNKYAMAATKKRFCPNSTINNAITTPLEKVLGRRSDGNKMSSKRFSCRFLKIF